MLKNILILLKKCKVFFKALMLHHQN